MKMKTENLSDNRRNSTFELLRLISMIMIVGAHYAGHGIQQVLWGTLNSDYFWLNGSFVSKIYTLFLIPGGKVGVAIFFMLSGHFMVKSNVNIKKILKLIIQIFYYSIFAYLLFLFVYYFKIYSFPEYIQNGNVITFTFKRFILMFIPISTASWWFVTAYVALYLFIPLLNTFLLKFKKNGFILFLLFFWLIWYSIESQMNAPFLILQKAIFFYSFGSFIKLFLSQKLNTLVLFGICLLLWLLFTTHLYLDTVLDNTNLLFEIYKLSHDFISIAVFVPLISFFLFLLFKNINLGYNKYINNIAKTTLGVYLIHDSFSGRAVIWNFIIRPLNHFQSNYYLLYSIISIITIFIICSIIDYIRIYFFEKKLLLFFESIYNKFEMFFFKK